MKPINWYPGHMAKARRELIENLKHIDVSIEIVDARAPLASRNPDFDDLLKTKERIILLNKSDLSDPAVNKEWIRCYKAQGIRSMEAVSTGSGNKAKAIRLIGEAAQESVEKMRLKGVSKTVRALVVGIPNVGKSTFINLLAGEGKTKTGDKPGVTKGKQWVRVTPYLELMDTPGLLWPKLEDQEQAKHLAYLGSINDEILETEELALELLQELRALAPEQLKERYKKITDDSLDAELLELVARSRGFLLRGGDVDTERAARIVLDEFRAGKIAKVSLEKPPATIKESEDEDRTE